MVGCLVVCSSQHRVQDDCLSELSVFYPDYTVCLWDHNFRTCMYVDPSRHIFLH